MVSTDELQAEDKLDVLKEVEKIIQSGQQTFSISWDRFTEMISQGHYTDLSKLLGREKSEGDDEGESWGQETNWMEKVRDSISDVSLSC